MSSSKNQHITCPPPLQAGDIIGLLCPAGQMEIEKTTACINKLEEWGYKVQPGNTLGKRNTYFSGTEQERLNDLQTMLDDPQVAAILCARGGYGSSPLIDEISWKKFRKKPKWIIGYSDITIIHLHLASQFNICSLHSPMAGAFNEAEGETYFSQLESLLKNKAYSYRSAANSFSVEGKAKGRLLGGNLSLVAHACGTRSLPVFKNNILFLEDIGEYLYNIDRMLVQLDRNGIFKEISGLVIGGFTDLKDTIQPYGRSVEQIIMDRVRHYGYPVCFGFPVGHQPSNYPLVHGAMHRLKVDADGSAELAWLGED